MKRLTAMYLLLVVMVAFVACGRGGEGDCAPQIEQAKEIEVFEYVARTESETEDLGTVEVVVIAEPPPREELPLPPGSILLFGEGHGSAPTIARQLELWGYYYTYHGMRHMFKESCYAGVAFLNMWMQADDDTILYELFEDKRGTFGASPYRWAFFRDIKTYFPETIFHGTDVAHQYHSTSKRFLQYLIDNDLQDSESYRRVRENIEQYRHFRRETELRGSHAHDIRSYYMPRNFIREFDSLYNQSVMAIHGAAHVSFGGLRGFPDVVTLAMILYEHYGDALQTFDMRRYFFIQEPYRVDTIAIAGIDFEASYFGMSDSGFEAWRLEDAYKHFYDTPTNSLVLDFGAFPMFVEAGQVLVVDRHSDDGNVRRYLYRATSGQYFIGYPIVRQLLIPRRYISQ